jgi:hypothetical protein
MDDIDTLRNVASLTGDSITAHRLPVRCKMVPAVPTAQAVSEDVDVTETRS